MRHDDPPAVARAGCAAVFVDPHGTVMIAWADRLPGSQATAYVSAVRADMRPGCFQLES